MSHRRLIATLVALASCARPQPQAPPPSRPPARQSGPDTLAIAATTRALSSDAMRGRGPWTPENERAARQLAAWLEALGARPVLGKSLLVPFTAAPQPNDTVYNVVGVLPARGGRTDG